VIVLGLTFRTDLAIFLSWLVSAVKLLTVLEVTKDQTLIS
jgi:hypothetical protein